MGFLSDADRFNKYCSGLQSIAVIVGLAVGGIWAWFLFGARRDQALAEVALSQAQTTLTTTSLELEEKLRAYAHVELSVSPLRTLSDGTCEIDVRADVRNAGNRNIRLPFTYSTPGGDTVRAALHVAEVVRSGAVRRHRPVASYPVLTFGMRGDSVGPLPVSSLVPGEVGHYPFLVDGRRDAVYLLQFMVPVDTARDTTARPDYYYTARTYLTACGANHDAPAAGSALHQAATAE